MLLFQNTDNFQNIWFLKIVFADFPNRIFFIILDRVVDLFKSFKIAFQTSVLFNITKIRIVLFFISVTPSNVVFHFHSVLVPKTLNLVYSYKINTYFSLLYFLDRNIKFGSVLVTLYNDSQFWYFFSESSVFRLSYSS